MPFSLHRLESLSNQFQFSRRSRTNLEAKAAGEQTAFLSHSSKDKQAALGLQVLLQQKGWNLYLYWQDSEMPEPPSRQNAENVQQKIREADWFMFLATPNSMKSKWCPWEIGYADGVKRYDNILIVPTTDFSGNWSGTEYLQLYRQITDATTGGLLSMKPNATMGSRVELMTPDSVVF